MENPKTYFARKFNLAERDIVPEFIPVLTSLDNLVESHNKYFEKYHAEIKQIKFNSKWEAFAHAMGFTLIPSIVILFISSLFFYVWSVGHDFEYMKDYLNRYPIAKEYSLLIEKAKIEKLKDGKYLRFSVAKNGAMKIGLNYKFEKESQTVLVPISF